MQNNSPLAFYRLHWLKKLTWPLKILLFGTIAFYISLTVREKGQGLEDIYRLFEQKLSWEHWLELTAVCCLTPLNWACESRKWQILVKRVQPISFWQAFQGVLAGVALGFALPNNVGDAAGRVLSLKAKQRFRGIGAALLSNALQFYVSLFFGTISWLYFSSKDAQFQSFAIYIFNFLLITSLILGVVLVKWRQAIERYLKHFGWYRRVAHFVEVIAQYPLAHINIALLWAVLRYGIFTLQFGLLLYVFEVRLGVMEALSGIFLVFFAKTLVPAFNFLGDLGVREASALFFLGNKGVEPSRIIAVSLMLWCINILLPAIIGTAFMVIQKWWPKDQNP